MRKSLLNFLGAAGLLMSASAYAAGLGGINVESALGQPLKADIELVALTPAEREKITVRLAGPEAYKAAGLELPRNRYSFQILNRNDGSPYLKVTTEQAVNDPFVSLLVELVWPTGRLLREYTFLLDPPGYETKQPMGATVTAIAPVVSSQALPSEPVTSSSTAATKQAVVAPPRAATSQPRATASNVATGSVLVRPGDTLRKIAAEHKLQDVTLERMLVGLYRSNVSQFDGNMNRLQEGKRLQLPALNELSGISQQDALKEIRVQAEDWHNYRQRLAGTAVTARPSTPVQQTATGKIGHRVADQAETSAEKSAQEVLRLSKGEAPGDKVASAGNLANLQQEDAIALAKAAEEARMRADMLEKQLRDMERLAQLKSEAAQEPATAAVSERVTAASEVAPAKPAPTAAPAPKAEVNPAVEPAAEAPALLDEVMENPLLLGGGAALLLGVAGFVVMRLKRRKEQSIFTLDDDDVSTPVITMPSVAAPAAATLTPAPVAPKQEAVVEEVVPDDVDPISEAELFLNFGRDVQAEEILKDAMAKYPRNHQIHLKLLAIYASRKDVHAFAGVARVLRAAGDEVAWQQAAAMGRKIDPDNPEYGGVANRDAMEDTGSATQAIAAAALGGGAAMVATDLLLDDGLNTNAVASPDLDFDLGASADAPNLDFNDTLVLTGDDMDGTLESTAVNPQLTDEADFNVPEDVPQADNVAEQSTLGVDALDFDLTATDLQPVMEPDASDMNASTASLSDEATLVTAAVVESDFDLDIELASDVAAADVAVPAGAGEALNPADFDFDLGELESSQVVTAAETEPATVDSVADTTDFDLSNAFPDLEPELTDAAEASVATSAPEMDFGDLNLDVTDEPVATEAAEPVERSENWHEVATKLDLAKAYQEMGDAVGAREILHEVLSEGDIEQQAMAQAMLQQLA